MRRRIISAFSKETPKSRPKRPGFTFVEAEGAKPPEPPVPAKSSALVAKSRSTIQRIRADWNALPPYMRRLLWMVAIVVMALSVELYRTRDRGNQPPIHLHFDGATPLPKGIEPPKPPSPLAMGSTMSVFKISAIPTGGSGRMTEYLVKEALKYGNDPKAFGRAAERLFGLSDDWTPAMYVQFVMLLEGRISDGSPALAPHVLDNHQPGWIANSAEDKSISTLLALAPPELEAEIEAVRAKARNDVTQRLEELLYARGGKGGSRVIAPVDVVGLSVQHNVSRNLDPHWHDELVWANLAIAPDGKFRCLASQVAYDNQRHLAALRDCSTAEGLRRLGIRTRFTEKGLEVENVPEALLREFSKSRNNLVEALNDRGVETTEEDPKLAAKVAREIRPEKVLPPKAELKAGWAERAKPHGFDLNKVLTRKLVQVPRAFEKLEPEQSVAKKAPSLIRQRFIARQVVKNELRTLEEQEGHWTKARLEERCFRSFAERGVSFAVAKRYVDLATKALVVIVPNDKRPEAVVYSTKRHLRLEDRLLRAVASLYHAKCKPLKTQAAKSLIDSLPADQKKAIEDVVNRTRSKIYAIDGYAGTGKGQVARMLSLIYKANGYEVVPLAPTADAARLLGAALGEEAHTIAKMKLLTSRTPVFDATKWLLLNTNMIRDHGTRAPYMFAKALETVTTPEVVWNRKKAILIDEASMASTQDLADILGKARRAGAVVILLADSRQQGSYDAGGLFRLLTKSNLPVVSNLTTIHRQRCQQEREAVLAVAESGDVRKALRILHDAGKLVLATNREKALEMAVDAYLHARGALDDPRNHRILCQTNREVDAANRAVQGARRYTGRTHGEEHFGFYRGDAVVFRENSKALGVLNAERGTIVEIRRKALVVEVENLDGTVRRVTVKPGRNYDREHLQLGYAQTMFSAQGQSIANTYVVVGGGTYFDRTQAYVALSRSVQKLQAFVSVDRKHDRVLERVLEDRAKSMALEVQLDHERRQRDQQRDIYSPRM
ncbi:MAG: AAA family ATPase [Gemmataceae bacterium]